MDDTDLIEEIHEIRRTLMKKAGGTPEAYVRHIMEQQKLNPDGLVDLSKPKITQKKLPRKPARPAVPPPASKTGKLRKAVTQ